MKEHKEQTRLELEAFEMESLNIENLNVEELERRLELTSGTVTPMDWGCDCDGYCNYCTTYCVCYGTNTCTTYCGADCPSYCGSYCDTDCMPDVPIEL